MPRRARWRRVPLDDLILRDIGHEDTNDGGQGLDLGDGVWVEPPVAGGVGTASAGDDEVGFKRDETLDVESREARTQILGLGEVDPTGQVRGWLLRWLQTPDPDRPDAKVPEGGGGGQLGHDPDGRRGQPDLDPKIIGEQPGAVRLGSRRRGRCRMGRGGVLGWSRDGMDQGQGSTEGHASSDETPARDRGGNVHRASPVEYDQMGVIPDCIIPNDYSLRVTLCSWSNLTGRGNRATNSNRLFSQIPKPHEVRSNRVGPAQFTPDSHLRRR